VIPSLLDLADLRPERLPPALRVPALPRAFVARVRPPGSKSLTNRALLLAALAEGVSTLRAPLLDADDARVMLAALRTLGARIDEPTNTTDLRITGVAGRWKPPASASPVHLDLHNAGTATRFLAAAALLAPPDGPGITIDGNPRMRQRPIGELTHALRALGANIHHPAQPDCPPVTIRPPLHAPASLPTAEFGTTASSQFISALLLAAPFMPVGLRVAVRGELTSPDYVEMTLALLARVGLSVRRASTPGLSLDVTIPPQPLTGFDLAIEPDASGATYFQAAAGIVAGSSITIDDLPADPAQSLQGDARFVEPLRAAGAIVTPASHPNSHTVTGPATLAPLDLDLARMPDTAMTAAVLACFASPTPTNPRATSTLRGLRTLRVKETDRLHALQTELTKLGCEVDILTTARDEALRISPAPDLLASPLCSAARPSPAANRLPAVTFDTYDDHRMAMSLALIGLRAQREVIINDPACVRKTYPGFWADLRRLYA
jgi:3-phosphoshikimate 1-carboxyvinyltransferase